MIYLEKPLYVRECQLLAVLAVHSESTKLYGCGCNPALLHVHCDEITWVVQKQ